MAAALHRVPVALAAHHYTPTAIIHRNEHDGRLKTQLTLLSLLSMIVFVCEDVVAIDFA
jgi:hypothetical protein